MIARISKTALDLLRFTVGGIIFTVIVFAIVAKLVGCSSATNSPGANVRNTTTNNINVSVVPATEQVLPR